MKKLVLLAVLLVFVGTACADIDTGLVGWWKMNESTGNIAYDSSGNGNDGTLGSSDTWVAGGGVAFDGGSWGASGIVFANSGADLIADMALTDQVTVSFIIGGHTYGDKGYVFSGNDSTGAHILSAEAPTGDTNHFLAKIGNGGNPWAWEAFNPADSRYIFAEADSVRISLTANFTTGEVVYYLDDAVWATQAGAAGSFADLSTFTIGRQLWAEFDGELEDFRIYNRALTDADVAELVPEPATLALLGLGALTLIRRKRN